MTQVYKDFKHFITENTQTIYIIYLRLYCKTQDFKLWLMPQNLCSWVYPCLLYSIDWVGLHKVHSLRLQKLGTCQSFGCVMLFEKPCKNLCLWSWFDFFKNSAEFNVQQNSSIIFVLGTYRAHSLYQVPVKIL